MHELAMQPQLLCFQKSKQTSIRKIFNFTVNRDHINKTRMIADTYRYSSGQLSPAFQTVAMG